MAAREIGLFELIFISILVVLVTLSAKGVGQLLGVPKAAAVILIIGVLALLMRLGTKISGRTSLYYAVFLAMVSLLSIGVERVLALDVRGSVLIAPLVTGVSIVIIGALRRRVARSNVRT